MSETVVMTEPTAIDPTAERRFRIVRIAPDFLLNILLLHRGTEVVDLSRDVFFLSHDFALKVAHPDFPAVVCGQEIPTANPIFQRKDHDSTVEFVRWGL